VALDDHRGIPKAVFIVRADGRTGRRTLTPYEQENVDQYVKSTGKDIEEALKDLNTLYQCVLRAWLRLWALRARAE
jgi:hypothetical protein